MRKRIVKTGVHSAGILLASSIAAGMPQFVMDIQFLGLNAPALRLFANVVSNRHRRTASDPLRSSRDSA